MCAPDVILWSVKDVTLKDPDSLTDLARWRRNAIEDSVKQLYGAQRALEHLEAVTLPGTTHSSPLPERPRQYHRIAVAFGARGEASFGQGDFGKGFVHVVDERTLDVLLVELDTVTDFVAYLARKEQFLERSRAIIQGGEEELLGLYIKNGRTFLSGPDMLIVGNGIWDEVRARPEWAARKAADAPSYLWDTLIERLHADFLSGALVVGQSLETVATVTRVMAREDRFARRILATSYHEFMLQAAASGTRARIARSPSGVVYVFLATPLKYDRQARRAELGARCFVARGLNPEATTVVGIATERREGQKGGSVDVACLQKPTWTAADTTEMERLQALGLFRQIRESRSTEHEFPDPE